MFTILVKIIFLDFTAKRVTLKWFNFHVLCKSILKQVFLAYADMQLDLLWVVLLMRTMILKKVDFDHILTPKRAILTPFGGFRGQITKITPEMDSLASKTYI